VTNIFLAPGAGLAARKLDGQMVILSAADSGLFILNEIGTALWEAADGRTPLADILDRLVCPVYDVDPETVRRDALEFVEALSRHGVLQLLPEPVMADAEGARS
jgi:hypothetical protein